MLRHEVNNPLTGILGNAELLLARRDQLPAYAVARLRTIADLAIRIREAVRIFSDAAAAAGRSNRSASSSHRTG
jgi:signal transduction histidine kinase